MKRAFLTPVSLIQFSPLGPAHNQMLPVVPNPSEAGFTKYMKLFRDAAVFHIVEPSLISHQLCFGMSRLVFYIRSTLLKPRDGQACLIKAWPEWERLGPEEPPEPCQVACLVCKRLGSCCIVILLSLKYRHQKTQLGLPTPGITWRCTLADNCLLYQEFLQFFPKPLCLASNRLSAREGCICCYIGLGVEQLGFNSCLRFTVCLSQAISWLHSSGCPLAGCITVHLHSNSQRFIVCKAFYKEHKN